VIRNPAHVDELRADGSEPVVCDLERVGADELAGAISGADAVVFAAGHGPGSAAERKLAVDRDGAIKLLHAARAADVERYVLVTGCWLPVASGSDRYRGVTLDDHVRAG
jgi:nucleoside-diphosphate-sugar epimerase